ncbi:dihydroxyacetone kinase subunit DhaK [Pelagibius marinus]|uniref:dihydroxyacetone kinase subunit DhaK n=1 Tax=Pelagibius marinus TaxID=2762760 RepID=UPI001872494F|nr:dihydroxyacetone kinase subunit DhaK [Pelagibius marinus]
MRKAQLADLASVPFSYNLRLNQLPPDCDSQDRITVQRVYSVGDGAQLTGAYSAEIMGRLAEPAALADQGQAVDAAVREADRRRLTVTRSLVDNYCTSLEMASCLLPLVKFDSEVASYWEAPVHSAALHWRM